MSAGYKYENEELIHPDLICSICQEPFDDPCSAPCGEIYCRECISRWIQMPNDFCPHCRQTVSIKDLNTVPRPIQNMLDRLPVTCNACEQTGLQRGNFDDHIQIICPKTIISCPSANDRCSWRGQRDQINLHLNNCRFIPMRSIITQLLEENQQLRDRVNLLTNQTTEQENDNKQLRNLVNQQTNQLSEQMIESEQLQEQLNQQRTKIIGQKNRNQQNREQIAQLRTQIDTFQRNHQTLQDQINLLTNQTTEQQNENQRLQDQVNLLTNQTTEQQNENQRLQDQVNLLTNRTTEQQNENQRLQDQINLLTNRTTEQQNENQRLQSLVNPQADQLSEQMIKLEQLKEQIAQLRRQVPRKKKGTLITRLLSRCRHRN